jgi:hypothetical protein
VIIGIKMNNQKKFNWGTAIAIGAPLTTIVTLGTLLYGFQITIESERQTRETKKELGELVERVQEGYKPIMVGGIFECGFPNKIGVYNCELNGENQKSITNDVMIEYLDGKSKQDSVIKCHKSCEERYQPFFARCALDKANKLMDIVDNRKLYSANMPRRR